MGDWEFCGEAIDVVEVTVRAVVVLLLQLSGVELLVVEPSSETSDRSRSLGNGRSRLCRSGRMEGATGGFGRGRSGGRRRTAASLCSLSSIGELLGLGELLGHLRCGESLAGMGAHRDVVGVDDDALLLVELVDVDVTGDASVARDHLASALGESGAHDGAFRGLLGELSEGGEAGGDVLVDSERRVLDWVRPRKGQDALNLAREESLSMVDETTRNEERGMKSSANTLRARPLI